jgi:hypothetical protein
VLQQENQQRSWNLQALIKKVLIKQCRFGEPFCSHARQRLNTANNPGNKSHRMRRGEFLPKSTNQSLSTKTHWLLLRLLSIGCKKLAPIPKNWVRFCRPAFAEKYYKAIPLCISPKGSN